MTDPSLGKKKKKITITASPKGLEVAENALIRLGFDSKSNFAKSQLLSRSTVTRFFQCEPIQLDSFKRICEALKLNWRETAGLLEEKQSEQLEINDCSSSNINEEVEQLQTLHRKVTVIDKKSKTIKAVITLEGDINSVKNWKILQSAVQEYSGDTIEITDIKEGSIKLFVEGSPEDIERLISRIKSGELKEVSGFLVEDVQILSESSDDGESNELNYKWYLVQEIVSHRARGLNLSGADLSDADLSSADLSGADLSRANLDGADLRGANLSGVFLMGTTVKNTLFGQNEGLSEDVKFHLVRRGAIFEDSLENNDEEINEDTTESDVQKSESQNPISSKNLIYVKFILKNLIHGNLGGAFRIFRNLFRANLIGANLFDADLSGANLSGANLIGANLSGANLSGANLSGANLIGANLSGANLSGANLFDANLFYANLSGANLRGADLNDADLGRANLFDANLFDADLSGADLSGANLSGANLSGANLSGASLSGANLSGASLSGANLSGASLFDASLIGADLNDADLGRADLRGAKLSRAIVKNALFGRNLGITEDMKLDLKRRGAIFEDSPGDRSGVFTPR